MYFLGDAFLDVLLTDCQSIKYQLINLWFISYLIFL